MKRRNLILAIGGATIALIGGETAWRVTRVPTQAWMPWQLAREKLADVRLDAFRHAILAPNPHNRQPWVIKLVGENAAVITCDLDRRIAETDPFDRQITIGFGCFLELARIAAAERGFAINSTLFPEGESHPRLDGRPVALLEFLPDAELPADPLYKTITQRRSNKEQFDLTRPVPAEVASKIVGPEDGFAIEEPKVSALRDAVVQSMLVEQTLPRTFMETVELTRIGYKEVNANPDGIQLIGPLMEGLSLAGQLNREQLADPTSNTFQIGIDTLTAVHNSIPALIWIKTPGNSRLDQIEAGRRYVRANLSANQLGVDMHPMSQSLQEYAEVSEYLKTVHSLVGAKGTERIQMLARIGYGTPVNPAPRWPLEDHIK